MTPLGDRAVRIARPRGAARAIVEAIRAWPGVVDVVVTRDDVGIYFAAAPPRTLPSLDGLPIDEPPTREHVLRVIYDGPDLDDVALAAGISRADVIAAHASPTYTVAYMGFLPGFAYLDGLDPRLAIARRATPRPRVPANSLAIAEGQTAVYPFANPGGWHLLGRVVGVHMFSEAGPLLGLGDRVRFAP
jgi:KipI family sensor histidine kinase inhibitor